MRRPRVRILPAKGIVAAAIVSLGLGVVGAQPAHAALVITVDCAAGDTIGAALVTARTTFDPVEIRVKGMCNERIVIDRDEVTLRGTDAASGLDGAGLAGTPALIIVNDAHRILLDTLRLTPAGKTGLLLDTGSALRGQRLEIEGANVGISLSTDTSLQLNNSNVYKSTGVGIASQGGDLVVRSCGVYDGSSVGISVSGGRLSMSASKVVRNASWGVSLIDNASGTITSSVIGENAVGVFLRVGGRLTLGSGASVSDSKYYGAYVWDSSTLVLGSGSTLEDNGAGGVLAMGASEVVPQTTTIKNNLGHGISARDTSLVMASGVNPLITGNTGWGIVCEGFPGDARLASPGYGPAAVFGNTAGQINCPGYFLP